MIVRNIIDEKQMSDGTAPHENSPSTDHIIRTNGGNKELIGDNKQSSGGRETIAPRMATTRATNI